MFAAYIHRELATNMTRGILPRLFLILTAWRKVTVLLLILALPGAMQLAVTFFLPTSRATDLVIPMSPALLAA